MQQKKKHILLVEDEPNIAFNLQFNLQTEGYKVTPAADGQIAIECFQNSGPYDLVILDVMLPEKNGFEVAKFIREKDDKTGILMLTALASDENRIQGLESGVDDYITKPFHLKELLLRVKRMLQRADHFYVGESNTDILVGKFKLNADTLILKTPMGDCSLTALEADVLKEFMTHPNQVLSREYLLNHAWGVKGQVETRTVDNFIGRLRKFLETDPTRPQYLISVRGRGYMLQIADS